jgi:hypothetical protein
MSFTLRLHISGLGLFTKQDVGGVPTMRVLMPETKLHGRDHQHLAKIYFEKQYIPSSSTIRSPLDMDGLCWTLPSEGEPRALPAADQMLVNLSAISPTEFKIPRPSHPRQMEISGEVRLPCGRFRCHGETAKFVIEVRGAGNAPPTNSVQRVMTNRIVWEVDELPGNTLSLNFVKLDGTACPSVELQEQDGVLELHLLNALQDEHDGIPAANLCDRTTYNHFAMYRGLFPGIRKWEARCDSIASPPTACKPPKLPATIGDTDQGKMKEKRKPAVGTRIYTCMLVSAEGA